MAGFRRILKSPCASKEIRFQNYIYQRFTNETGEPNLQ